MVHKLSQAAMAIFLGSAVAFPAGERSGDAEGHEYQPPKATDARSPCPALNTLANHGYLPRDGRNIARDVLVQGFLDGFGFEESAIAGATFDAFQTCLYVTGKQCDTITNLTILAEPHLFEHDMSMSRQDYKPGYADGGHVNNFNFNATVFDETLKPVGNNTHVGYALANEIHLNRESLSYQNDYPGWFVESRGIQLTEFAFMYAAISDPSLPNFPDEPQLRLDWWKYWFTNEALPIPLGWKKPYPPRNGSFIQSASSRVEVASLSRTPSPLPSNAVTTGPSAGALITVSPATLFPIPTDAPYVAPDYESLKRRDNVNERAAAAVAAPNATPAPFMDKSRA